MTKRIVHDEGLSRQVPGPPPRQQPKRSEIVASEIDSRPRTPGQSTKAAWREQLRRDDAKRAAALWVIEHWARDGAMTLTQVMPHVANNDFELAGVLGDVLHRLEAIQTLAEDIQQWDGAFPLR